MTKKFVHVVNDVLPWRKMVENVWEIRGPEPDVMVVPRNLNYKCFSALQGRRKYLCFQIKHIEERNRKVIQLGYARLTDVNTTQL